MPSPFPGMDPYLEDPDLWPDVHNKLISECQTLLVPLLRPGYMARMECRVYVSDDGTGRVPDLKIERLSRPRKAGPRASVAVLEVAEPITITEPVEDEVEEPYLAVRSTATGVLVAVLEVLSPTNKLRGSAGRQSYLDKRREIFASPVHWVEIDLLRAGERKPAGPPLLPSDYRAYVSRGDDRRRPRYWPIHLRQRLPVIGLPLHGRDRDVPLDLGLLLSTAYDRAGYDQAVAYGSDPTPPLSGADAKWANQLLRKAGLR